MKVKTLFPHAFALLASQLCVQSQARALSITPSHLQPGAVSYLEKSKNEVCLVPGTVPGLGTGVADKDQEALCAIDFYSDPTIAICPKEESTNPAIEPYQLPTGITQAEFEAKDCAIPEKKRAGKKLAKFKSTITCSDTAAILSYYELSNILGGIGNVPSTVFRTMNLTDHRREVLQGESGVLKNFWEEFAHDELSVPAHPELFTSDHEFVYGALSKNPTGDTVYEEFYGHPVNYADGFHAFTETPLYAEMTSANPLGVAKTLAAAAQKVTALKDMSDMVLIDTLLNQQDRFGNEAKQSYYVWVENGALQEEDAKKADPTQMKANNAVMINKLLLKDNDCGVSKTNLFKQNNTLAKVRHMSAKTYHLFMTFAEAVAANPSKYAQYFETQMIYSQADWVSVSSNIASSRATLLANCKSGFLALDLDLDAYLGLATVSRACE